MALYVDSAYLADVTDVCAAYPVAGVTTNPTILLAAIERGQHLSEMDVLRELLRAVAGEVFMQPVGDTAEELQRRAEAFIAADPRRVVPKLPVTPTGIAAGKALKRAGARIAMTAAFSAAQVYCAATLGADWIIPYFGRLRRAGIDPCERLTQMAQLVHVLGGPSRILAASLKTPADVVEALLAGSQDVTLPADVIRLLTHDPLTDVAIAQFTRDAAQCAHHLSDSAR